MQKPGAAPLYVSKAGTKSRSDLLDKGKKAGGLVVDAEGIGSMDLEAFVKAGLRVTVVASHTKFSRSDLESVARHCGSGGSLTYAIELNACWIPRPLTKTRSVRADVKKFGSLDIDAFLKVNCRVEASVSVYSPSDLRSFASKGKSILTVVVDAKSSFGSLDADHCLKAGASMEIHTGAVSWSASDLRGFSDKGHIEVRVDYDAGSHKMHTTAQVLAHTRPQSRSH